MYAILGYIYANIWGILMVNVTIYSIHEAYGYRIYHMSNYSYTYIYIINYMDEHKPGDKTRGHHLVSMRGHLKYLNINENMWIIWLVVSTPLKSMKVNGKGYPTISDILWKIKNVFLLLAHEIRAGKRSIGRSLRSRYP